MFMEGIFVLLFSVFVFCIAVMDSDSGKMSPLVPSIVMFWLKNGRSKGHSASKILSIGRGHFGTGSHHMALHLGQR